MAKVDIAERFEGIEVRRIRQDWWEIKGKAHRMNSLLGVRLSEMYSPVSVYVNRLAQHWRVCDQLPGPAIESHSRYPTWEEAVQAAIELVKSREVERSLRHT